MVHFCLMKNKWAKSMLKLHKSLALMEKTKYLDPKHSYSCDDLVAMLRRNTSCSNSSRYSSNIRDRTKSNRCKTSINGLKGDANNRYSSMPNTPIYSSKLIKNHTTIDTKIKALKLDKSRLASFTNARKFGSCSF